MNLSKLENHEPIFYFISENNKNGKKGKSQNPTTALLQRWGRPRAVTTPKFETQKSKKENK